ncbi:MAG: T9SS type A sorting domain-containing protein, partial [Bacteroidales bacterium]|nr:T9SS type A sorting domain-containing protein [Bacteroidales bacterium]
MLGADLPLVPVCDLAFHGGERMLVAATYGRSMYKVYLNDFVSLPEKSEPLEVLNVFPNPAQKVVTIKNPFSEAKSLDFEILDITGKVLQRGDFSGDEVNIEIHDFLPGSYLILVSDGQRKASGKFIRKN